ncbi:DUF6153 family protein [Streptosporangium sp. NPDC000396]|uniref:DUF6153 family protein n=1 Tax=Streptosporangium sp. NPDC000396 TaxID=3366185 RepID=UPI0036C85FD3
MQGKVDGSPHSLAWRVPRWLLSIALVLGVAGMHTLGHLSHEQGHGDIPGVFAHVSANGHGGREASPPLHSALTAHVEEWISGLDDTFPRLDPTSVCLAVLTSFLLLLLLAGAASAWTRRIPEVRPVGPSPALLVARPPPQRTVLRLARLSVLRI